MKTKVNALTLNEMVIVMIITSIVIGLAFTVLTLVQRHMWSIQKNFNLNTEYNRLHEVLWVDIHRYNTIDFNALQHTIKFKTVLDSTVYRFEKDYVLKDLDTFYLPIAKSTFYFKGLEITKGKLDAIKLELAETYKDRAIFMFKPNDSKHLID
ncbi:PulJ/GspJ family protein [Winogradskyella tangerina]|uniref:PulJ/GspJ family protein n=1 Tax=Winogradskyella tangerina TaxID=2023240 RepID=UPI000DBE326E|nr:hypothetical protein [Winogradskyella tangerina]